LLSHTAYLWRARTIEDIALETLQLFTVVHPRPGRLETAARVTSRRAEIVVFGLGRSPERFLGPEVTRGLLDQGIAVEQMGTPDAVHTFNVLNDEGRPIGGALLALEPRDLGEFGDPFAATWR